MVIVFAYPPKNAEIVSIHRDLIQETCDSFGVKLTREIPKGTLVYISQNGGTRLQDAILPDDAILIIGCDDNQSVDIIPKEAMSIRVDTPSDYFLWSGVALGIVLHWFTIMVKKENNMNVASHD